MAIELDEVESGVGHGFGSTQVDPDAAGSGFGEYGR
jgi:hypothetical protein